jgi:UDP-2,4-diacetamido-2,4,6-trideoxy-beta-L-altropyranose hydrolase
VKNLLMRADATTATGTGHFMRCLALAQAWQTEGNRATFLSRCESRALRQRAESAGIGFIPLDKPHPSPDDLRETLGLLNQFQAAWLVVDGYHFDPDYHHAVQMTGCRLLVIDDTAHLTGYHADILLNQNITAEHLPYYRCDRDTKMLLGTRYTLLRDEFLAWRGRKHTVSPVVRKLLVTMGGSDPDNATAKVIQALQQADVPGLETRIIAGSANPHVEELKRAIQDSDGNLQLLTDVSDMPEQMAWADMAVAAGGTTCGELAFMGVPSLVFILAENQRCIAEGLARAGAAINLGWFEHISDGQISDTLGGLINDVEQRVRMQRATEQQVDGKGGEPNRSGNVVFDRSCGNGPPECPAGNDVG